MDDGKSWGWGQKNSDGWVIFFFTVWRLKFSVNLRISPSEAWWKKRQVESLPTGRSRCRAIAHVQTFTSHICTHVCVSVCACVIMCVRVSGLEGASLLIRQKKTQQFSHIIFACVTYVVLETLVHRAADETSKSTQHKETTVEQEVTFLRFCPRCEAKGGDWKLWSLCAGSDKKMNQTTPSGLLTIHLNTYQWEISTFICWKW